jgi:predicted aldo/keto reductase-like oxidoreductase
MKNRNSHPSRRDFLQSGALAAMAVGTVPFAQQQAEKKKDEAPNPEKIRNYSKNMRYRPIGDTGVFLSALSLGGGHLDNPALVHRAIEGGVNIIHMSYDYENSKPMTVLAEVLKTKRDKLYIALKDEFPKDAPGDLDPVLKMLGTERVDFIFFNRHKAEQIFDPAVRAQFEVWKAQGKVSTCGLTTHGDVKACIAEAVDCGLYSIIHAALPQSGMELAAEEIKRACEKGIGIMPMKTVRGITDPNLQILQFKKLLANPAVTTVNRGISSFDMLDTHLNAVKETLTAGEDVSLYRYARMNRADRCAMCGSCERACPRKIEISALLRAKAYYHDQLGDRDKALSTYRGLSRDSRHDGNCLECRACEAACPNGIQIVQNLNEATGLFRTLLS